MKLQRESELTRQKVSECIKDLIQYTEENLKVTQVPSYDNLN